MPKIALITNPWFSIGIHIDHKDPSLVIHMPGLILWIGWFDVMGCNADELIWVSCPIRTVEVLGDRHDA